MSDLETLAAETVHRAVSAQKVPQDKRDLLRLLIMGASLVYAEWTPPETVAAFMFRQGRKIAQPRLRGRW